MKKVLALILALVMTFAFVACSDESVVAETNPVEEYFDANGEAFINGLNSSFESSSGGLTCKTDWEVSGNDVTFNICIQEVDNVPDDAKKQMQDAYDSVNDYFADLFTEMQAEVPELESVTYNVCEEDGDLLAVIKTGK